jgi:hypothetical protein
MTGRSIYTESELHARLRRFEAEFEMESEDFLTRWEAGELPRTDAFFVWAGLCSRLGVRHREFA